MSDNGETQALATALAIMANALQVHITTQATMYKAELFDLENAYRGKPAVLDRHKYPDKINRTLWETYLSTQGSKVRAGLNDLANAEKVCLDILKQIAEKNGVAIQVGQLEYLPPSQEAS